MNMINNLFSIFDPSSYYIRIGWISIIIPILSLSINKFKLNNKWNNLILTLKNKTKKEIIILIKNNLKKGNIHLIISIFMVLIISNFIAIMPFLFTHTAHISISLPAAITLWIIIILFGWINSFKKIIIHLVPIGTPAPLINFIVLIEITRNLIRPITLSVRLTANMVAGHLLLSLLGNFSINRITYLIVSILPIITLTILEIIVSIIQAYVFTTLLTLYHNEIF